MARTYGDVSKEWLDAFIDSPKFDEWLARSQRNYDLAVAKMYADLNKNLEENHGNDLAR